MTRLRCAIYTRKSSEEGLEQSFNSLDAQREACGAYIVSQKSEGWKALPENYDDGGFSGGKMDRPALQRLLRDIAARLIDIVVVYKVDRLTRSLADFAKIVEVFDQHQVSFVSVTQAFNTTSSMGRLTLNVLLSFAQFEREVTGERIRDKIAASKAKGMWMGGYPPLGYEVKDRRLALVPEQADTVRHIFARYLALKSVNALAEELAVKSIVSKRHISASGRARGGAPYSRGALFHLLRNRIYLGEIVHKTQSYPGKHEAIVDLAIFERAQRQLSDNAVPRTKGRSAPAPLTGLIFDAAGFRMTPAHAHGQSGARYRYYASITLPAECRTDSEHVSRVSAPVIEHLVIEQLRTLFGQPASSWPELIPNLRRVQVHARAVVLELQPVLEIDRNHLPALVKLEPLSNGALRVRVPACMRPRKGTSSVSAPAAQMTRAYFDRALIAALKRAHRDLVDHDIRYANASVDLSKARGFADPYTRRIAALAFLAPDIQRSILQGRQPPGLTLKRLTRGELPLNWAEQRERFGFARVTAEVANRHEKR